MFKVIHIPGTAPSAEVTAWFERARKDRFDGVEIEIGESRTCELSVDEKFCRELRLQAEHSGTRILAANLAESAVTISAGVEDWRLEARERVRTAAAICGRLGAETLRMVPAAPPVQAPEPRWRYQDALNESYRSLQILRGDFERAGVVGALEVCRYHFLLSPPETRELIDRVNSPWIGAAVDWEGCQGHGDPRDWIESLGPRLAVLVIPGDPAATDIPTGLVESASQALLVVR